MTKLKYKPVAVQDECFGTFEKDKETTVLVKFLAQGKTRIYEKNEAMSFDSAISLKKYVRKNKLKIIPYKKFKASEQEKLVHLLQAI